MTCERLDVHCTVQYLRTWSRYLSWKFATLPSYQSLINFPIYEHLFEYIGTQSPHLPVYCMGRRVRLHCFFFQMGILDMIQHFMHEILIGSSQYFTSYCIEASL
jgi:hypothetical protein